MFCKKGVLWNFLQFTEKHQYQILFFNKVAGLRPSTLLKKRLWHMCFPVNFAKFLRTLFFIEHLWWLLLNILQHHGFPGQSANQFSKTLTSFTYDSQMFVSTITHDFCRQSMTDPSGHKTKTELWSKRKILLFPKIRVTRKNFTRAAAFFLFFLNQFNWIF